MHIEDLGLYAIGSALVKEDTTAVQIPTSLFKRLEENMKMTSFTSVSSYVTFLLRGAIAETVQQQKETFSKEDEDKVKDRLRALGYIE